MRQEVYRVAFEEANAELSEILGKFELLRLRKDRIEKVVEALKPLLGMGESQAPAGERGGLSAERQVETSSSRASAEATPPLTGQSPYSMQQPTVQPVDSFARRVESLVGQGSPAKDVSEYSRLFNTGTGGSRGN